MPQQKIRKRPSVSANIAMSRRSDVQSSVATPPRWPLTQSTLSACFTAEICRVTRLCPLVVFCGSGTAPNHLSTKWSKPGKVASHRQVQHDAASVSIRLDQSNMLHVSKYTDALHMQISEMDVRLLQLVDKLLR